MLNKTKQNFLAMPREQFLDYLASQKNAEGVTLLGKAMYILAEVWIILKDPVHAYYTAQAYHHHDPSIQERIAHFLNGGGAEEYEKQIHITDKKP